MIHTAELFEVFKPYRGDSIVIPGRGGRFWVKLTENENLDATLGDPSMGGCAAFGLGIALAQPKRKVMLFDSEGDIHMSMGMLSTIAEQAPANLYHFLIDNGMYATTGGQPVPNADNVDYAGLAKASGYPKVASYDDIKNLKKDLPDILNGEGPIFIHMKIVPEIQNEAIGARKPWNPRKRPDVIAQLHAELAK
ncbi:MAG: thiamine pyrophosphate-dependent enzyme [Rhodospirillales bacterium]